MDPYDDGDDMQQDFYDVEEQGSSQNTDEFLRGQLEFTEWKREIDAGDWTKKQQAFYENWIQNDAPTETLDVLFGKITYYKMKGIMAIILFYVESENIDGLPDYLLSVMPAIKEELEQAVFNMFRGASSMDEDTMEYTINVMKSMHEMTEVLSLAALALRQQGREEEEEEEESVLNSLPEQLVIPESTSQDYVSKDTALRLLLNFGMVSVWGGYYMAAASLAGVGRLGQYIFDHQDQPPRNVRIRQAVDKDVLLLDFYEQIMSVFMLMNPGKYKESQSKIRFSSSSASGNRIPVAKSTKTEKMKELKQKHRLIHESLKTNPNLSANQRVHLQSLQQRIREFI